MYRETYVYTCAKAHEFGLSGVPWKSSVVGSGCAWTEVFVQQGQRLSPPGTLNPKPLCGALLAFVRV